MYLIVETLKEYKKNIINEYIIILANYRYRPQLYTKHEYFDIVRMPAIPEVFNDFYFTDEKNISVKLVEDSKHEQEHC